MRRSYFCGALGRSTVSFDSARCQSMFCFRYVSLFPFAHTHRPSSIDNVCIARWKGATLHSLLNHSVFAAVWQRDSTSLASIQPQFAMLPCEKTNTNTVTNTSTNTSTNTFPLQRCPCKQSQSASKKTKYGKLSPPPRTPYQSAAFKCKPDPKPAPETESKPATGWRSRTRIGVGGGCSLLVWFGGWLVGLPDSLTV